MIPPSGDFTVLGPVWDVKGNIFKCKFRSCGEGPDAPECEEEGTVLFLHKLRLTDDSITCDEESCKCRCHESTCSEDVLRDISDTLNESWASSLLEADVSQGTGPLPRRREGGIKKWS